MRYVISHAKIHTDLLQKIQELSGQNVFDCYQCGNCSSGCPLVEYMDYAPNQVIRLAQLGALDELLESETIWICATCLQCSSRCPKGVDVSKVMEALRVINLRNREGRISPDDIEKMTDEEVKELPPIVLVSAFRKLSG
ncbi:MAG: 4Fe-4S dicluster domain-containing protein [Candidatus Cloacimonetes bacterium]|nr:4Fe-4S dicluster domain-containing protein [Candidatus Cloacimonadota bacterium]